MSDDDPIGDTNVLLIMTDEHRPDAMGCAGHPHVQTPAMDRLAEEGAHFTDTYCPSPLCVPSRAAFATGQHVHQNGYWDNATPYDGTVDSWGHYFADHDIPVTTIGKLDYEPGVDTGFNDQREDPAHRGTLDMNGLRRDPPIQRSGARDRILGSGTQPDDADNHLAEENITEAAVEFLENRAEDEGEEPWVCWVNYHAPHFMLRPLHRYAIYDEAEMDLPKDYPSADSHPIVDELRRHFDGKHVPEDILRKTRTGYYGLCTGVDDQIGTVIDRLDDLGLDEDTLVIYTSDHGESLGDHELWWKCNAYEESAGVPLIMRGPGIDAGRSIAQPSNLLDLVPTMADAVGIDHDERWQGESLLSVASGQKAPDEEAMTFSEYHAHGVSHGWFMLRQGPYKYVYYPHNPDQLFDLEEDPDEMNNLAQDPSYGSLLLRLKRQLFREVEDHPDEIDQQALSEQRELLEMSFGP